MLPASTLVLYLLALLPRAAVSSLTSASTAFENCIGKDQAEAAIAKCSGCFDQNWNGSYSEDYSCDETIALDCEAYGKCSVECLAQDKCGKSLEEALLASYRWLDCSDCPFGCTQTYTVSAEDKELGNDFNNDLSNDLGNDLDNDLSNVLSSGAWTLALSPLLAFLVFIGGLTV
jgi:hypothetical protein